MKSLLSPLESAERTSVIAQYVHWETDDAPDVAAEAARCRIRADDLVVAKSMGTMVLLEAFAAGRVPGMAVLIGTPLNGYEESQVDKLKALVATIPCLLIQQTDDFTGSFAQVAAAVGSDSEMTRLEQVDGGDHVYADTEMLASIIRQWLQPEGAGRG